MLSSTDVIDILSDLRILRGIPRHIRFDNGPDLKVKKVQSQITADGAKKAYIVAVSPSESSYIESCIFGIRYKLLIA